MAYAGNTRAPVGNRLVSAALIALSGLVFSASLAEAQNIRRVDGSRLSCDAVHDIIVAEGAIILKTRSRRSGRQLSERYVAHRGFCFANEITEYRTVSTRDTHQCPVLLCRERPERRRFFDD